MKKINLILPAFFVLLVTNPLHSAYAVIFAPDVIEYGTTIDVGNQEVTFNVLFDGPPDFSTILGGDELDHVYSQVLQFNIDPTGTLRGSGKTKEGLLFTSDMRALACDASNNLPGADTCHAGTYSVHDENGIILSTIGVLPFDVIGNLFTMTVPFNLINENDGYFTYVAQDAAPDVFNRWMLYGTSGQSYSAVIPEPTTLLLFAAGILGLALRRRTG